MKSTERILASNRTQPLELASDLRATIRSSIGIRDTKIYPLTIFRSMRQHSDQSLTSLVQVPDRRAFWLQEQLCQERKDGRTLGFGRSAGGVAGRAVLMKPALC